MTMVWKYVQLGAVVEMQKGFAFKSGWFSTSGRPIVKVSNFTADSIDPSGLACISEEIAVDYLKYELKAGDVVVQTVGSWPANPASVVGKCIRVPNSAAGALLNQNAVRLDPSDGITRSFLYYLLRSDEFKTYIIGTAQGAASQAAITLEALRAYEFSLPPLPTQRRIGAFLATYDELIENCQQRIRILEEMARALYREWFVHFRFPNYEEVPQVDSPLGIIPKGWEVKELASVCSRMNSGGTPKRGVPEYWEAGDVDWFKTKELWDGFLFESEEKITERALSESSARLFDPGTILMAIYGSPTVGRLGIVTRPSACNQAALGLVADPHRISQTFLFITLLFLRDHFNGLAQGAAQQNISKEKVASTLVWVPPGELLRRFDKVAAPTFTRIKLLQQQIANLRCTRDLLLPRLLSGQVMLKGR